MRGAHVAMKEAGIFEEWKRIVDAQTATRGVVGALLVNVELSLMIILPRGVAINIPK